MSIHYPTLTITDGGGNNIEDTTANVMNSIEALANG